MMEQRQQHLCYSHCRHKTKTLLTYVVLTAIISTSSAGLLDELVDQGEINNDDATNNNNESASSSWWESMDEGLEGQIDIAKPANRRGSSATYFLDKHENEWMIVSGGFTDEDWHSMPVWAYDLTSGKKIEQYENMSKEEQNGYAWNVADLELYEHPWVSMNFGGEQPQGRVGHLSSVYNDCLYIFGGLTYNFGFSVEYPDDGYNSLVIWKGCGLNHYLKKREGLVWEKIIPTVPEEHEQSSSSSTNATPGKGDDYNSEHDNNLRRKRRDLGIPDSSEGFIVSNESNQRNDGQLTEKKSLKKPTVSITILPRGELKGGHYSPQDDDKEYFIFHGGVIQGDLDTTGQIALGDVWKYDYGDNTLTALAPYPPPMWQRDERNELYPMARTAHAATVVGDELIIHGGMHPSDDILDDLSSSFSSPSDSYATYHAHSRWKPLSDIWVFNLKTLKWKERIQYPQMARSYHTIVGSSDGQIAAFGGFQQDISQYSTEPVVFVFKDLLISRPNETYWQKLIPPGGQLSQSLMTRSHHLDNGPSGITNRLEHSAIIDKNGSMFVWGGRFQTVNQISGLWRLDVFTKDANLNLEVAPPDGMEEYERELEALHLFLVTMMLMSLSVSTLLNSMRARQVGGQEAVDRPSSTRRRGLSPDVINSLPIKRYQAPKQSTTDDGDVVDDVSLSRENSAEESDLQLEMNTDCCPICLVEYEEGISEIRTLPCGHGFDKECIDSWLENHTTCPVCRQGLDDTPTSPRSGRVLFNSWLSPSTGVWSPAIADESETDPVPEAVIPDLQEVDSRQRSLFRFFTRRGHEPVPTMPSALELV